MTLPSDSSIAANKTISMLLESLDQDLAANIVFSAISLNSKKILDTVQACIVVSSQREIEKANREAGNTAKEIVEKAMGEMATKLETDGIGIKSSKKKKKTPETP